MEDNKDILTKLAEQYGVSRREAFLMVRRAWISSTIEGDAFGQDAATVLDDMGIDPNIGNTPSPTKADANSKDIRERFNEKNLIGTASLDQEPKRLPEDLLPVDADFLTSRQYDENSGLQPYLDKLMADGEIKPVSRHLNLKSIGDTPVPEKIAGLGDPIVIEIPDAVEAARNFDPYPPLDQDAVEKTFKIVYPEDCGDSEKWVLYHIVLEHSGLLTSERLVEYATDKDSDFMRREMARELCDVLCRAWVNDMPGGTFMDHRPHVKVDYREYVKGNGGKIIVEFSTEFLH